MEKSVLITGAAGFIGSHLCERFLEDEWVVIALDNFLTGRQSNINHLLSHKNFSFVKCNVNDSIQCEQNVAVVLHFACPASPVDYLKYPLETMKVGSIGTFNTIEFAKKHNARYILASTSEVYGDPLQHPQTESYWGNVNPVGPRSVYDEAKRFSEAIAMSYFREYQLDVRITRIFNTYGPRMKSQDGRVIPNFINQALNNTPITVYGDGQQTRSFCFVSDLVEGIFRLATCHNLQGEIINLGNPDEYTISDLVSVIQQEISTSSPTVYKELPEDDPRKRKPNIQKAIDLLNWSPQVDFRDGLKKTIDYFRSYSSS
ncbi:UDP-glucuronic acid decarboxylase family protein [Candidatus Uabimicrobium amorphum]|uniref:Epimerase n=1 Tax=Uabimicrobium amorphum TaxID=2596890 RepID=A0A5S9F679_UABAM|nr:UDP-glucuronic acid decarboxylase family protein [Candidatus Uabimicrobium amorphum]BBM87398.1 epimerase [Candidatus Uabimicrobium amorphum]